MWLLTCFVFWIWNETDEYTLIYSKTCVRQPLSKRPKIGFQYQISLNAGQKYWRMLQGEHSAILSTFIKLPFVIKIFVLSIFKWPFYTGFYCFVVRYFISILVLQSSWWGRDSWLLCLVCLPGVSWLLRGSSSQCHVFVCSLWLWYFLIILTYYYILYINKWASTCDFVIISQWWHGMAMILSSTL